MHNEAMRAFLKKQSLINKMMILNCVGIAAAMLVVLVFVSSVYSFLARRTFAESLLAEARLLAVNTAPMLAFHDKGEAAKLAATFKQMANVMRVAVFDSQNEMVVELLSDEEGYIPVAIRQRIREIHFDTTSFEAHRLIAFIPVFIDDERLGTVVIEHSLAPIKRRLLLFVSIEFAATVSGILLSLLILRRMQLWALSPIMKMSALVEQVARSRSYHLRVKIIGRDEVARLARRLNQMLERIEIWDKDLHAELDQRRKSEKHLGALAKTDELTRLPNRLAFVQDLDNSVMDVAETGSVMALLFIDLDDFKQVNDIHGHHCGDNVLCITAKRFLNILRDSDRLYRLGGDEFAAILAEVTDNAAAVAISERLIASAGKPIAVDGSDTSVSVRIGASVGVAFCPTHAASASDLLHRADLAMYAAKRNGKNSFRIFDKTMET